MEDAGADSATSELNGQDFHGRPLTVNEARERPRRGGGGGGGDSLVIEPYPSADPIILTGSHPRPGSQSAHISASLTRDHEPELRQIDYRRAALS